MPSHLISGIHAPHNNTSTEVQATKARVQIDQAAADECTNIHTHILAISQSLTKLDKLTTDFRKGDWFQRGDMKAVNEFTKRIDYMTGKLKQLADKAQTI